ncbi:hypothetical protein PPO43_07355 [Saprospira sp. CCB-QB6]|uniref:hypothetical protein n=1 Tax=Saprospira sp. CCB-QB6 TaxID=3023936 RepID=UPI0023492505|nr:hypothetical protein [Saprospira sp. CCB-QB6]WCL82901.1 hypothetical protein PPO43_07355 [Saprospira sp. CCB-QB6]
MENFLSLPLDFIPPSLAIDSMSYYRPFLALLFFGLVVQACNNGPEAPTEENPLARVYDNYLYASALDGIGKGLSPKDSAQQAELYIDKWIMDQMLLGVAQKQLPAKEAQRIDRLAESYKASLVIAYFEQELINRELDTTVTPVQLAQYYNANKDQYIAGESWLRCHFIRVPRKLEGVDKLRNWFKSDKKSDEEKVKQFCLSNESQMVFALEKDRWVKYKRVADRLPENRLPSSYLEKDRVFDRSDSKYVYLCKVFEYKDKDEPAPLPEVQDEISRIILHQRRQLILDQVRKEARTKAKEGNVFERF